MEADIFLQRPNIYNSLTENQHKFNSLFFQCNLIFIFIHPLIAFLNFNTINVILPVEKTFKKDRSKERKILLLRLPSKDKSLLCFLSLILHLF